MNLIYGWDEEAFKNIADRAGSKQAKKDVSFCQKLQYHNAQELICIRYENIGGVLAYHNAKDTKIVMVAVDEAYKRQGIASALVMAVISIAQKGGKNRVYTRTKDGYAFYSALHFSVIGKKDDDYIMERRWNK